MEIKRILWATDGSKEADSSLRYTIFLAEKFGAKILCLFVSDIEIPITTLYAVTDDFIIKAAQKVENRLENKLKRVQKKLKGKGIDSTYKIVRDETTQGIIKAVKKSGCDLIVMGKHGQGFIERMLIGSNTSRVLKKSPVPVLSVCGRARKKINKIEKILVPVDVSSSTNSAISSSLDLAEVFNASVTLLYVFWLDEKAYDIPHSMVEKFMNKAHKTLERKANQAKKKFLRTKNRSKIKIDTQVIHGTSPSSAIRGYVSKNKIDLIITNTHDRKGLSRIILGSDAERIIREAPCPVLVVRP